MHVIYERRLSHRKWRNFIRRERRRRKRQKLAKERDKATKEKILALMSDPIYRAEIEEQERLHEEALRMEEEEAQRQREEWCARDLALHSLWLKEQEKKNNILKEKEMKEEQLKREWKERQKKEEKERQEKQMQQESLLQEATSNLGVKEATHNPEPPVGHARIYKEQKIQPCPFFTKTGACRFGTQCSREHDYPSSSVTILLPNMYSHFGFVEETADDYDTDLSLEFSESDRNQHFRDFFFDVLPEFEKCGKVIQFKVCCNKSPHLRGNVYVQYNKIKDAEKAVGLFNGRWYAGKQISCIFVPIERWRPAICGLHWSQKCPKGDRCNFLHVYRNPGNAFFKADKDHYIKDYDGEDIEESFYSKRNGRRSREESDHRHRSSRSSTRKKRRENSRTRDRSDRSRSRSRARESSSSRKLKNGSSSRCRKHTSRSRSSSIRKRKSRRSRSKS